MTVVEQKLHVTLITGRTIEQGVGKELGKGSPEYFDSVAVCFLDPVDVKRLGLKSGANVKVTSPFGSVIVKAKKYTHGTMSGMIFMPCGLWANIVCGSDTDSIGMPTYRGFTVEVESAPGKSVLSLDELLKQEFGK
jgi:formylmethanofuran dehydrogenase subunit D